MPPVDPVSEIAFSIQFAKIANTSALDVASFFEKFKDRFPLLQQVARLGPIQAQLQLASVVNQLQFAVGAVELPRVWLISSDSNRLLQFQDDRFGFNWRRAGADGSFQKYPGYVALRKEFSALYAEFLVWARRFDIGIKPDVGELTYVNSIPIEDPSGKPRRLSELLSFFTLKSRRQIQGFKTEWIEPLSDEIQGFVGVQAGATGLPNNPAASAVVLNIVARVALTAADKEPLTCFDLAHDRALALFTEITRFGDGKENG